MRRKASIDSGNDSVGISMSAEPYYRKFNNQSKLKEKQSKATRTALKAPVRSSLRNFWNPPSGQLNESEQEVKSYNDIWLSATGYLQEKSDQMISLPPESSERLFIEALMGTMKQFEIRKEDGISNIDLRDKIKLLVGKITSMFEGKTGHGELHDYMLQLSDGMMQLHNNISVEAEPEPEPEPAPEGDLEGDLEGDVGDDGNPDPDPEPDEDDDGPPPEESDDLARNLGL